MPPVRPPLEGAGTISNCPNWTGGFVVFRPLGRMVIMAIITATSTNSIRTGHGILSLPILGTLGSSSPLWRGGILGEPGGLGLVTIGTHFAVSTSHLAFGWDQKSQR